MVTDHKDSANITMRVPMSELSRTLRALGIIDKSASTLDRWCSQGCRGKDGELHIMPYKIVGGWRHASPQEVLDFLEEIG